MRVAVTRPQADGERSAAALRARGHDVLLAPLMRVEPMAADLSGPWSGIVITSANALIALSVPPEFLKLPLFAVGDRSAQAARAAGFTQVEAAGGELRDLVRLIAQQHRRMTPLVYLAGEDRAADLVRALARHRINAEMRVVYRAVIAPFPPALIAALRDRALDAVLHYSKRSAETYLAGARAAGIATEALAVRHVCLSAQVAAPLQVADASCVAVAKHPDEASLIELLQVSGR